MSSDLVTSLLDVLALLLLATGAAFAAAGMFRPAAVAVAGVVVLAGSLLIEHRNRPRRQPAPGDVQ